MANKKLKVGNVPNLRFPEFTDEWETKKLGEVCEMQAGKFVSASEIINERNDDLFPCYGGNGLRGYTKSFNKSGTYSLIGRQGALCGNVTFVEGRFHATEHAVIVTPYEKIDTSWLYYLLINLNLNQYATGMAQPGLSVQNLVKIETASPKNKIEQVKNASLLLLLDKRITTQNKIIEQLETLIRHFRNQIFKQKIRFNDNFDNEFSNWKIFKLADVSERIVQKNADNNQNVLTISAQFGLISQLDFFNKSVSAKDVSGYYLLGKNDFAYNKSYSNGYPMGAIKRLKKYEKGIVSTLYICFRFNQIVSVDFMEHYFESGMQNNEIEKIAQEGARNHGLLNVGVSDFFNMEINLPSLEEQKVIASFLTKVDQKIQCEKATLEQLEMQKKYLLQQMFV